MALYYVAGLSATEAELEGMELTRSAVPCAPFSILTQSWEVRHPQVCFIVVETEALMGGWFLSRWWGACSRGPSLLPSVLSSLSSGVPGPPLQLKFRAFTISHSLTSSHQTCLRKTTERYIFISQKKSVAANTHPLTNYKLLEYRVKESDQSWWDKNLVSQSWENPLQSLCCINIVCLVFNVEWDQKKKKSFVGIRSPLVFNTPVFICTLSQIQVTSTW